LGKRFPSGVDHLPGRRRLSSRTPLDSPHRRGQSFGMALLEVQALRTVFLTRRGQVRAVDGVDLALQRGRTLGIVGASGCGKSVRALSIIGLLPKPAGRIASGRVLFDGRDLTALGARA